MAYDKVIDSVVLDSKLTAIANAIREKTSQTSLLTIDEMPASIQSIPTGEGGSCKFYECVTVVEEEGTSEIKAGITVSVTEESIAGFYEPQGDTTDLSTAMWYNGAYYIYKCSDYDYWVVSPYSNDPDPSNCYYMGEYYAGQPPWTVSSWTTNRGSGTLRMTGALTGSPAIPGGKFWSGYEWLFSNSAYSKAATITEDLSWTVVRPDAGKTYTEDALVEIASLYQSEDNGGTDEPDTPTPDEPEVEPTKEILVASGFDETGYLSGTNGEYELLDVSATGTAREWHCATNGMRIVWSGSVWCIAPKDNMMYEVATGNVTDPWDTTWYFMGNAISGATVTKKSDSGNGGSGNNSAAGMELIVTGSYGSIIEEMHHYPAGAADGEYTLEIDPGPLDPTGRGRVWTNADGSFKISAEWINDGSTGLWSLCPTSGDACYYTLWSKNGHEDIVNADGSSVVWEFQQMNSNMTVVKKSQFIAVHENAGTPDFSGNYRVTGVKYNDRVVYIHEDDVNLTDAYDMVRTVYHRNGVTWRVDYITYEDITSGYYDGGSSYFDAESSNATPIGLSFNAMMGEGTLTFKEPGTSGGGSSAIDGYIVTGAGSTQFNGTYKRIEETYEGAPIYVNENGCVLTTWDGSDNMTRFVASLDDLHSFGLSLCYYEYSGGVWQPNAGDAPGPEVTKA